MKFQSIQIRLTSKVRLEYDQHGLVQVSKPVGYIERLEELYWHSWYHITFHRSFYSKIRHAKIAQKLNNKNQRNIRDRAFTNEELNRRIEELHTKIKVGHSLNYYFVEMSKNERIKVGHSIYYFFTQLSKNDITRNTQQAKLPAKKSK